MFDLDIFKRLIKKSPIPIPIYSLEQLMQNSLNVRRLGMAETDAYRGLKVKRKLLDIELDLGMELPEGYNAAGV